MARDLKINVFMNSAASFLFCLLLSLALVGCNNGGSSKYTSPPVYNLQKPTQYKLPLELDEISGVVFYAKDSSVFAINDEKGWLYKIKIGGNKEIQRWKFSKGADFEDLALVDSIFYILRSNGAITRVQFESPDRIFSQEYKFDAKGDEFESIYYDTTRKQLILICKDCESDKKKALSTYAFDPVTNEFTEAPFSIDVKPIAQSVDADKIRFKPSAAAINPVDSLLYIISSVNKLLVVTDREGHFKNSYPINPSFFKQPEGITFTPSGTMIISNESGGVGVADLLIFSPAKAHK